MTSTRRSAWSSWASSPTGACQPPPSALTRATLAARRRPRRSSSDRSLFSADAQHFHHQLVQRGFTVKQTVLISYGLALFFALAVVLIGLAGWLAGAGLIVLHIGQDPRRVVESFRVPRG